MTFWKNHRALVTGGAGFGGAHLCEALLQRGAQVTVLDKELLRDSYLQRAELLPHLDLLTLDIRDADALKLLLERRRFDTVFHVAAQPIVGIANRLPAETFAVNVGGTINVLEAARLCGAPPRVVFASSGAYYGATSTREAISEDAPPLPAANIYAPSKVAGDVAVRSYAKTYGLRAAVCRWMNTYGPGDTNFSRIVPATLRRLSQGKRALIDGTDGSNVLELLHVRDMASGYLSIAQKLDEPQVRGEAFNFGGGIPLSLHEVTRAVTRVWNQISGEEIDEEPEITGPKVSSVKYLDIEKAARVLAWQPRIELHAGLCETVEWFRRFEEV